MQRIESDVITFAGLRRSIQSVTDTSVGAAAKQREQQNEERVHPTPIARGTLAPIPFPLKLRRCLGCDATLDNLDDP